MARQNPMDDSCVGTIVRFVVILGGLIALVAVIF